MKNLSTKIRITLFLLLLMFLILPFFQAKFKFINVTPLSGAINQPEKEYFSIKNWFTSDYQVKEEKYLNETFGFRNLFIRINNQIAFNLFNKAKANGVIIGKNNYLYEVNYIKAYYGIDFIGIDSITHRMKKLKYLQDTLTKLNKTIIIVFAAGKGSFYPEYFPKKYIREKGKTNYEYHIKLAKELGLNYIDFNKYFIENKNTSKYPLYPKYGIHWSHYGMCLAADSIIRYLEKIRNIDIPNIYWNSIELAEAKESDYDIADGMNLMFKLKSLKMAYPLVQIQSDSGKIKPSVLVISDSFYWGLFNLGIINAFSNSHFWFYNHQIYPDSYQSLKLTSQVNLREEIAKHDIIILMATEATLPNLGWGFIENMYGLFKRVDKNSTFNTEFQKD